MNQLTDAQLNSLPKDALILIVSSLQDQLALMGQQLDQANAQLADNHTQMELLLEQVRLLNHQDL